MLPNRSESGWGGFFFSSRRRHTRYWRDWSSDVCSSDLPYDMLELFPLLARLKARCDELGVRLWPGNNIGYFGPHESELKGTMPRGHGASRAEERRGGKEGRSRRSPYKYKKNHDPSPVSI